MDLVEGRRVERCLDVARGRAAEVGTYERAQPSLVAAATNVSGQVVGADALLGVVELACLMLISTRAAPEAEPFLSVLVGPPPFPTVPQPPVKVALL